MLAKKPDVLELDRLPPESAEYLRAQSDQIAFLNRLIRQPRARSRSWCSRARSALEGVSERRVQESLIGLNSLKSP